MNSQINKIVLLGEKGAGKSCLVFRLCKDKFRVFSETTIGVAFVSHKIHHNDRIVPINIWDTAGSDRFNSLLPLYLRNVDVALVCFQHPKLEKISNYVAILQKSDPDIKIFLVITKVDLWASHTTFSEIFEYASDKNLQIFKTSSISGDGVVNLFNEVADILDAPLDQDTNVLEPVSILEAVNLPNRCC